MTAQHSLEKAKLRSFVGDVGHVKERNDGRSTRIRMKGFMYTHFTISNGIVVTHISITSFRLLN